MIKKIHRSANWGLYGSIAVLTLAITFHYSPYKFATQSPEVSRWLLIAAIVLVVLDIVAILMRVRKSTPAMRQMEAGTDAKLKAYASYIASIFGTTFAIVLVESVIMSLISVTELLMPNMLLVLVLFLCYPNMYKMKHDLGLTDEEMKSLFGDQYIADPQPADAELDLPMADARLAEEEKESEEKESEEKECQQ